MHEISLICSIYAVLSLLPASLPQRNNLVLTHNPKRSYPLLFVDLDKGLQPVYHKTNIISF